MKADLLAVSCQLLTSPLRALKQTCGWRIVISLIQGHSSGLRGYDSKSFRPSRTWLFGLSLCTVL